MFFYNAHLLHENTHYMPRDRSSCKKKKAGNSLIEIGIFDNTSIKHKLTTYMILKKCFIYYLYNIRIHALVPLYV